MTKESIWLVNSEPTTLQLLSHFLTHSGFDVLSMRTAKQLDDRMGQAAEPDLLLIDSALPDENGLLVLRRLREQGLNWPMFMLSASSDPIEMIVALEVGADDFLIKPLNPRELLARIRACLRRIHRKNPNAAPKQVKFGPFVLDLEARSLEKNKKPVHLTTREFELLRVLVSHPNESMDRQALAMHAMGRPLADKDRSLDVQMARLRKLIEPQPDAPRYLQTVWGSGYVFTPGR